MRGWIVGLLSTCAVIVGLASACSRSSDGLLVSGSTSGQAQGGAKVDACATPGEGCSCTTSGQSVPCGRVDNVTDGFALCAYGNRVCGTNNQWGACTGTTTTQRLPLKTGDTSAANRATRPLDLGTSISCAAADVCDPYCNTFIDTPVSFAPPGFGASDGGLVLLPGDGGMALPSTLQLANNGLSTCAGATNLIGTSTCDTAPFTSCQQDSRCDGSSHMCMWNGGEGYFDPAAAGPDLEIGAACGVGSGAVYIPLCNRGSSTVAAATPLGVNFTAAAVDGCVSIGMADCSAAAPAGGLTPGQCINLSCNVPAGDVYAVVNAGGGRDVTEPAGRCGNNGADVQTAGAMGCAACGSCNTQVTGTVWDPGMNVGLANVTVYELAGTTGVVPPIADNVGGSTNPPCDTCASLLPPSTYTVAVNTDSSGNFTLTDATPGTQQRIVAQSGRWRREATVNVGACGSTSVNPTAIRMPRDHTEGDIPRTALAMGNRESLECWLEKVGIATDEISTYTGSGTNRIQLFRTNGMTEGAHDSYSAATPPDPNGDLWSASGALNDFSAVILPCESLAANPNAAAQARMLAYANAGGRIFMDHQPGHEWLENGPSPWNSVSTWRGDTSAPTAQGLVYDTTTAQMDLYNWLAVWAPYTPGPGVGWLESDNPRADSIDPSSATTQWVRGSTSNSWPGPGNFSLSFSFETPLGAPSTCGRVIYNGMHVSQSRAHTPYTFVPSEQFPQNCDLSFGLTAEEKALEYQFFQLTACALGGGPSSVPPPPPALMSASFYVDYDGVCQPGYSPVWQIFDWNAVTPPGTDISFRAATAPADADGGSSLLPPSPPAPDPTTVAIGDAVTTTLPPPHTVDYYLRHPTTGEGTPSQQWLRVYFDFTPSGILSPALLGWQQFYDCVPAQ